MMRTIWILFVFVGTLSLTEAKNVGTKIPFFDSFATFGADLTSRFTNSLQTSDYKLLEQVANVGPKNQAEAIAMVRERDESLAKKLANLFDMVDGQIAQIQSPSADVFLRNFMKEAETVSNILTILNVNSAAVKKHSIAVVKAWQSLPIHAQNELIHLFPDISNLNKGKVCWTGAMVREFGFLAMCTYVSGTSLLD